MATPIEPGIANKAANSSKIKMMTRSSSRRSSRYTSKGAPRCKQLSGGAGISSAAAQGADLPPPLAEGASADFSEGFTRGTAECVRHERLAATSTTFPSVPVRVQASESSVTREDVPSCVSCAVVLAVDTGSVGRWVSARTSKGCPDSSNSEITVSVNEETAVNIDNSSCSSLYTMTQDLVGRLRPAHRTSVSRVGKTCLHCGGSHLPHKLTCCCCLSILYLCRSCVD